MLIRLTEKEFERHLSQEFGNEDSDWQFTRLGVLVNGWDNGIGCGLMMLSTIEGEDVRYLHYQ